MPSDLRTEAIILRRTNYGESDRILSLITPQGKYSVVAKSVRKEKSRLAGGIELFGVSDVVIHQGHSNLGTLTSAKMLNFYSNIIYDMKTLELASSFLKQINRAAEQTDNPEYYKILKSALSSLNARPILPLVESWFLLNIMRASGEEINLIYDINNQKLDQELTYRWDQIERAFVPMVNGPFSAREIKLARFLLTNSLTSAAKIQDIDQLSLTLLDFVRQLG